ncbi:unnamed protein product [Paramecium primaurelia]|uniref:Uncharacterized protein n=1 Tax=Paramecium primaurelia TaxID=5886 RepID=A0A8S1QQD0_PARPR|nr:unnamed protein product [Paramecium primaurelia]
MQQTQQRNFMLNVNHTEPKFGRLACVECIEENPFQYISLKEANNMWNTFIGQSEDLISEEKKHLKWLQKKLNNQKIIIIIHQKCSNQKQQRVFRLPQIRKQIHFYLDEKSIEKMIDLLSQQDKNILQQYKKQDRLDKLFYQNVKSKLETLIKHDLLCKQQLMKILQDQQDNSDL